MADKSSKMEQGYKDGLKAYKGREGSKVEEFVTKNVTDPLDKIISGDKDKEYVEGFKKAREELLGYKKGGAVKESKKMVKKEIAFMKKKGAPKSMIKHEKEEAKGMKAGGPTPFTSKTAAYQAGTYGPRTNTKPNPRTPGPRTPGVRRMASGGSVSSRADGCAQRGKTKGKMV